MAFSGGWFHPMKPAQGWVPPQILTTGVAVSEAKCMRDWLVYKGIAPDRIFMEDRSVNTEENLLFSKEIISENGLPEKITLITDGYHQLRAEMIAEKLGIKAYNISGRTSWYIAPTYWVREWFGVVYYKLFG